MSIRLKFILAVITCLILVMTVGGFRLNALQTSVLEQEAMHRGEMALNFTQASLNYVDQQLRPALENYTDEIILEGMSSTWAARHIMKYFNDEMPEYIYKQATTNPLNPVDQANPFEQQLIDRFQAQPTTTRLTGYTTLQGEERFYLARPMVVEASCLKCHGQPESAPKAIVERYGRDQGYGWQVGEIISALIIYIPTQDLRADAASMLRSIQGTFVALTVTVSLLIYLLFRRLVSHRIHRIAMVMNRTAGDPSAQVQIPDQARDEIGMMAQAFNRMSAALHHLYSELEQKVRERTVQLTASKQEAEAAFEQLKATQNELIQSEKMAVLGQLVAGVAHEINTPLGAIQASANNTVNALSESLIQLPQLYQRLSPQERTPFFGLLVRSLQSHPHLTGKARRQCKRALTYQLEANHINQARRLADTLTDVGIYEEIDSFLPLLQRPDAKWLLKLVYNLSRLQSNSRNILTAVEQAAKVVFALRSYARHDTHDEKQLVHITEGIDTVLELYRNQLKHNVKVIRDYQLIPKIWCYPDGLIQVWTNLIQNALQAMNGRGQLRIQVTQCHEFVMVQVADSGCGIPPELHKKIFEPFFTTKLTGEGSGLGLDIVRRIIDKHQGHIDLVSRPGQTKFRVWLPLVCGEHV
ncbi:MAG: DUF3365 domain-containing protein [Cyanothece sp. SIO1E1]|nr:DUF3365 domain-containing protein [Cyanothece sp. SIO1E1]